MLYHIFATYICRSSVVKFRPDSTVLRGVSDSFFGRELSLKGKGEHELPTSNAQLPTSIQQADDY
jgi:hypothetical protein